MQLVALALRHFAVDRGGMHQQGRGRETVIAVVKLAGMLLAVDNIGDEALERFEHGYLPAGSRALFPCSYRDVKRAIQACSQEPPAVARPLAKPRIYAFSFAGMTTTARTQVAIIGGGPAGLLLSHILHRNGIDSIVLERQSRAYVLERIRAGVLEAGTVALLREVGLGARMDREGQPHAGSAIAWEDRPHFLIDAEKFTGKPMMAYGQTAITEDLYAARDAAGGLVIDEAADVRLHDLTSGRPFVTYDKAGSQRRIDCDYVAGCDGSHGVSRLSIPVALTKTYEK